MPSRMGNPIVFGQDLLTFSRLMALPLNRNDGRRRAPRLVFQAQELWADTRWRSIDPEQTAVEWLRQGMPNAA